MWKCCALFSHGDMHKYMRIYLAWYNYTAQYSRFLRTRGNTKEQDFDMAPSLVACDDNDTVLRTLVYSKAEACKTTFLFLFFFLSFFLLSLLFTIPLQLYYRLFARTPCHERTTTLEERLSSWHSWANFHFANTWLVWCRNFYVSFDGIFIIIVFFFLFLHTQWKKRVQSKGSRDSLNLDCYS